MGCVPAGAYGAGSWRDSSPPASRREGGRQEDAGKGRALFASCGRRREKKEAGGAEFSFSPVPPLVSPLPPKQQKGVERNSKLPQDWLGLILRGEGGWTERGAPKSPHCLGSVLGLLFSR